MLARGARHRHPPGRPRCRDQAGQRLSPPARAWLAAKGYDKVFGARPLGRVLQKEVRDPLTSEILFGRLEHGGTVTIDAADEQLTFSYEARPV